MGQVISRQKTHGQRSQGLGPATATVLGRAVRTARALGRAVSGVPAGVRDLLAGGRSETRTWAQFAATTQVSNAKRTSNQLPLQTISLFWLGSYPASLDGVLMDERTYG